MSDFIENQSDKEQIQQAERRINLDSDVPVEVQKQNYDNQFSPKPEPLTQDDIDAVMMDESQSSFKINDRVVNIKPLKIKYQKQFAKLFQPIIKGVAMDMSINNKAGFEDLEIADFLYLANNVIENVEILPDIIKVFCHNDGYEITPEELDDCTLQMKEMQDIVLKYCRTCGVLEKRIADFFDQALPKIQARALELMIQVEKDFQENLDKPIVLTMQETSENTAS